MDAFIGSNKQHQLELDWTQYEEVMNNYEALAVRFFPPS
jgi:hypothetical protein